MMGRIVDGPTAAQLRASLERALDCGDHEDQGAALLAHQRGVMHAIAAGVRARRGFELGDPSPSGTEVSEATSIERAWARARAESGL
jgi:hypothetical protein